MDCSPETPEAASAAIRQVVPFASAIQGLVVLHAAAVSASDGAWAFVGESGVGKSTLALHLSRAGFDVLSDDLLPCRLRNGAVAIPFHKAGQSRSRWRTVARLVVHGPRRRGARRCHLASLSSKEAFLELLHQGFGELAAPEAWRVQAECYARLARQAACFRVSLADDARGAARHAKELIAHLGRMQLSPHHLNAGKGGKP
jgi:hypothetical protein